MSKAYLGLGSNIGFRENYITQAIEAIGKHPNIDVLRQASLYESEPVGLECETWFINTVISVETTLSSQDLLDYVNSIEKQLGRIRPTSRQPGQYESRTIDIDILFYDDAIINTPSLKIPHPRAHQRAYVLVPMLELAPEFIHPLLGEPLSLIRKTLFDPEKVILYKS